MDNQSQIPKPLQQQLLDIARKSIASGLQTQQPIKVNIEEYDPILQQMLACFVTLTINQQLRGCIGHLTASQPLVQDVAENAYAAAFRDPRFAPLTEAEYAEVELDISVLGKPYPVEVESEDDLIQKLHPGVDGLIIKKGYQQATFLPSVWKSLPDPLSFVQHLKQKAGLPVDQWSDDIQCQFYQTQSFS